MPLAATSALIRPWRYYAIILQPRRHGRRRHTPPPYMPPRRHACRLRRHAACYAARLSPQHATAADFCHAMLLLIAAAAIRIVTMIEP